MEPTEAVAEPEIAGREVITVGTLTRETVDIVAVWAEGRFEGPPSDDVGSDKGEIERTGVDKAGVKESGVAVLADDGLVEKLSLFSM